MVAFIIRRILFSILVLIILSIITFLLLHIMPGDPVTIMLGVDATPARYQELSRQLWLDRPLAVQYVHWLGNVLQGDFGMSITNRESVSGLIAVRLPVTMYLSFFALILSAVIGIGTGLICAIRRGSLLDTIITLVSNIAIAVPVFWLGILGIYFFGLNLGWLPIQGFVSPFDDFWLSIKKSIMPVICIAIPGIAFLARQTRSSMLEIVRQDYIRTAWSKGLRESTIVIRHALKNALIPVVTLLGIELRTLVGGAVLVETVFNIPGMGRLTVTSVINKDFITVQACVLIVAVVVLLGNLIVDVSYGWIDPRIRYQ
jgi:peptide/nickel transport system permease protein